MSSSLIFSSFDSGTGFNFAGGLSSLVRSFVRSQGGKPAPPAPPGSVRMLAGPSTRPSTRAAAATFGDLANTRTALSASSASALALVATLARLNFGRLELGPLLPGL